MHCTTDLLLSFVLFSTFLLFSSFPFSSLFFSSLSFFLLSCLALPSPFFSSLLFSSLLFSSLLFSSLLLFEPFSSFIFLLSAYWAAGLLLSTFPTDRLHCEATTTEVPMQTESKISITKSKINFLLHGQGSKSVFDCCTSVIVSGI